MIVYNIDKLDKDVNCPISYVNDIYVNDEKIKYVLKYVYKIYDVKSIEEHYGGIDNKGQYYINNFWFSKLCFVSLYELRNEKIEQLKTKIYGLCLFNK